MALENIFTGKKKKVLKIYVIQLHGKQNLSLRNFVHPWPWQIYLLMNLRGGGGEFFFLHPKGLLFVLLQILSIYYASTFYSEDLVKYFRVKVPETPCFSGKKKITTPLKHSKKNSNVYWKWVITFRSSTNSFDILRLHVLLGRLGKVVKSDNPFCLSSSAMRACSLTKSLNRFLTRQRNFKLWYLAKQKTHKTVSSMIMQRLLFFFFGRFCASYLVAGWKFCLKLVWTVFFTNA